MCSALNGNGYKVVILAGTGQLKVPAVKSELLIVSTASGREFAMLPALGPAPLASSEVRGAIACFFSPPASHN